MEEYSCDFFARANLLLIDQFVVIVIFTSRDTHAALNDAISAQYLAYNISSNQCIVQRIILAGP